MVIVSVVFNIIEKKRTGKEENKTNVGLYCVNIIVEIMAIILWSYFLVSFFTTGAAWWEWMFFIFMELCSCYCLIEKTSQLLSNGKK